MNFVDVITPHERWATSMFARDVAYQAQGAPAPVTLRLFMRRLNAQELLAAAIQQGSLAVVDADLFARVVGNPTPRRYDRIIKDATSFAVERWASSPETPPYTFFKITVLGGQQ
jgi:hypothetical protein